MPNIDQKMAELVSKTEGINASNVTGDQLADYFLSVGVERKGQVQSAYSAKGYALGADVEIDPGKLIGMTAAIEIKVEGSKQKQGLVIVSRGPRWLDNELIVQPVVLSCLIGTKWTGSAKAGIEVGLGAEVKFEEGKDGYKGKAEHDFKFGKEEEEEEEESDAESNGVSAAAFIGLQAEAGLEGEHYFGWDPVPMYYAFWSGESSEDRKRLKEDIVKVFSGKDRKHMIRDEAAAFLNQVRNVVKPKASQKWDSLKDTLGITAGFGKGDFSGDRDKSQFLAECLLKLQNARAYSAYFAGTGEFSAESVMHRAKELRGRVLPFATKEKKYAASWMKIATAAGNAGANLGAKVEAKANFGQAVKMGGQAKLTVAGVDFMKRRTRVIWQSEQGRSSDKRTFYCTQDTVIDYTSFSAAALKVNVEGKATFAGKHYEGEKDLYDGFEKNLNVMAYRSAILYWSPDGGGWGRNTITPLPGSGYAYGQSFVINNLLGMVKKIQKGRTALKNYQTFAKASQTKFAAKASEIYKESMKGAWLRRMAERLHVTKEQLWAFLSMPDVGAALEDLANSSQDLVTADDEENWGDKSVLIEASFAATSGQAYSTIACENGKLNFDRDMWMKRMHETSQLQAMRMRFRMADKVASKKSFRLGFKIGKFGLGFTFRKIEEAGAEGIIELARHFLDSSLSQCDKQGWREIGDEEHVVPPVALFSQ